MWPTAMAKPHFICSIEFPSIKLPKPALMVFLGIAFSLLRSMHVLFLLERESAHHETTF